jgi:release factor glutamine methyltransferase
MRLVEQDREKKILRRMRSVPENGTTTIYLGSSFFVGRDVFWPHWDSVPLVRNLEVHPREQVLDLCTGAGNIAVHAFWKGAGHVVAVDINPAAVESARKNVKYYCQNWPSVCSASDVREGDLYNALSKDEKFDVITGNPPFTRMTVRDSVEAAVGDPTFDLHKRLFEGTKLHLREGGRMYLSNSNIGSVDEMYALAEEHKFRVELIGRMRDPMEPIKVFYAFELKRK